MRRCKCPQLVLDDLSEKQDRERTYLSELHSIRSDMTSELRGQCLKYETEVKSLQLTLTEERDTLSELEGLLLQKETELDSTLTRLAQQDASYRHQLQQAAEQFKQLENAYGQLKRESEAKA